MYRPYCWETSESVIRWNLAVLSVGIEVSEGWLEWKLSKNSSRIHPDPNHVVAVRLPHLFNFCGRGQSALLIPNWEVFGQSLGSCKLAIFEKPRVSYRKGIMWLCPSDPILTGSKIETVTVIWSEGFSWNDNGLSQISPKFLLWMLQL